jgi:hypothetical protein
LIRWGVPYGLSVHESQALVPDFPGKYYFLKKAKQLQSSKQQLAAFRKAAREVGADDNEDRFKDALRTVAKAKPKSESNRSAPKAARTNRP